MPLISSKLLSRRALVLGTLLVGVFAMSAGGAAETEIRLVTGNDYAPYTDQSLPEGGLVNELVKRIYDNLGAEYTIDWKPWRRGFQEGVTGEYLATYPYIYNEERNRYFLYSDVVYKSNLRLFSMIAAALRPQGLEDARGRRMCLPLGWAPGPKLGELFAASAIHRDQPPDMETCFRLLSRGRTDFVLANEIQGWDSAYAAGLSSEDVGVSDFNIEVNPVHVIFSRRAPNHAMEVERFNAGLATLKATGEYDTIVEKHLKRLSEKRNPDGSPPDSAETN